MRKLLNKLVIWALFYPNKTLKASLDINYQGNRTNVEHAIDLIDGRLCALEPKEQKPKRKYTKKAKK